MSIYQQAKQALTQQAIYAKETLGNDKPGIRQHINDTADMLCREMIGDPQINLSDRKKEQYSNWLHNYAASLNAYEYRNRSK